jgi:hypothetical protein
VEAEKSFEGIVECRGATLPKLIQDVTRSVPHRFFPFQLVLLVFAQEGYIGWEQPICAEWETVTHCRKNRKHFECE